MKRIILAIKIVYAVMKNPEYIHFIKFEGFTYLCCQEYGKPDEFLKTIETLKDILNSLSKKRIKYGTRF